MLTKARELRHLAAWFCVQPENMSRGSQELLEAIGGHLDRVESAARARRSGWQRLSPSAHGPSIERALGHLDAAEAHLLRLAPPEYLRGQLPSVQAHVNRYLPKNDPRRLRIEKLAREIEAPARGGEKPRIRDFERDAIVAAYHAASSQRRRDLGRLRSFFRVLVGATVFLTAIAIAIGVVGTVRPYAVPLCFHPVEQGKVVCPTEETAALENGAPAVRSAGATAATPSSSDADIDDTVRATATRGDILIVELVGLIAAALASAAALRGIRGTSTPYRVPLALALLKLPTGALTAVLGLLLMRGGFVPGLSALDTSAQILAWALVFGYAQQLLTGLVDRQAHGVLNDVGGSGAAGDRKSSGV
jgi:hypothetical protein